MANSSHSTSTHSTNDTQSVALSVSPVRRPRNPTILQRTTKKIVLYDGTVIVKKVETRRAPRRQNAAGNKKNKDSAEDVRTVHFTPGCEPPSQAESSNPSPQDSHKTDIRIAEKTTKSTQQMLDRDELQNDILSMHSREVVAVDNDEELGVKKNMQKRSQQQLEQIECDDEPIPPFYVPGITEDNYDLEKKLRPSTTKSPGDANENSTLKPSRVAKDDDGVARQGGTVEMVHTSLQANNAVPPEIVARSSHSSSPIIPQFDFEVEAMLVQESSSSLDENVVPPAPICEAVPIPERPCRRLLLILAVGVLLLAVILGFVIGIGNNIKPGTKSNKEGGPSESCVRLIGPLLGVDPTNESYPVPAIDGETAGISQDMESIRFLHAVNGGFEEFTTVDIDYVVYGFSISGNVAVVGAPLENDNTGAIFVYESKSSGSWDLSMKVVPDDGKQAWFGKAVRIDGDVFAVTAPHHAGSEEAGSVYIYRSFGTSWELEQKIYPEGSNLGPIQSVSVNKNTIAIGDWKHVHVYVFDSGSWMPQGVPLANDGCNSTFGSSLALTTNDDLLVGCQQFDRNTGAVFYYKKQANGGNYVLKQKITASDGIPGDNLGDVDKISLYENRMVVGTFKEMHGKAYLFTKKGDQWLETAKIDEPEGSGRYFGDVVAMSKSNILIRSNTNVYAFSSSNC